MNVGEKGINIIKEFEGVRLAAYLDSVGVPTIGYGHTKGVQMGDTCTEEQANEWLKEDCADAEDCVNSAVSVPLTQSEFDALVSFVFNLGCGAFRKSTLLRLLLDSDYDGACQQLHRFNKAGGKELAGLTRRRAAEAKLFESV